MDRLLFPAALVDYNHCFLSVNGALRRLLPRRLDALSGLRAQACFTSASNRRFRAWRQALRQGPCDVLVDLSALPGSREKRVSLFGLPLRAELGSGRECRAIILYVLCPLGEEQARDKALMVAAWDCLVAVDRHPGPLTEPGDRLDLRCSTPRENEVQSLDRFGCDTKQIADILSISPSTVRVLRARARLRRLTVGG